MINILHRSPEVALTQGIHKQLGKLGLQLGDSAFFADGYDESSGLDHGYNVIRDTNEFGNYFRIEVLKGSSPDPQRVFVVPIVERKQDAVVLVPDEESDEEFVKGYRKAGLDELSFIFGLARKARQAQKQQRRR